jgi:hypothetical protein
MHGLWYGTHSVQKSRQLKRRYLPAYKWQIPISPEIARVEE